MFQLCSHVEHKAILKIRQVQSRQFSNAPQAVFKRIFVNKQRIDCLTGLLIMAKPGMQCFYKHPVAVIGF